MHENSGGESLRQAAPVFDAVDVEADDVIVPLMARDRQRKRRAPMSVGLILGAAAGALLTIRGGDLWQVLPWTPVNPLVADDTPVAIPASPVSKGTSVAATRQTTEAPPQAPRAVLAAAPVAAAPDPTLEAPPRKLSNETITAYLERADGLLASGDLVAARLFFERVAEAGDERGALGLAQSYDPQMLRDLPIHGLSGDQREAEHWRETARTLAAQAVARR